jgi:hypothetical protein
MIDSVLNILSIVGGVVSVATIVVASLERFAEITPSTKDDIYVAKIKKCLGYVSYVLDPLNVYTTKDKYRG